MEANELHKWATILRWTDRGSFRIDGILTRVLL